MAQLQSSQRVRYEPLRSLAFSSMAVTYNPVGTAFVNPVRIMKVYNTTDQDLAVSFDGITDEDVVTAGGFYLYDFCSNNSAQGGILEQPAGQIFYIRYFTGLAPSEGHVYVTIIYAAGN